MGNFQTKTSVKHLGSKAQAQGQLLKPPTPRLNERVAPSPARPVQVKWGKQTYGRPGSWLGWLVGSFNMGPANAPLEKEKHRSKPPIVGFQPLVDSGV